MNAPPELFFNCHDTKFVGGTTRLVLAGAIKPRTEGNEGNEGLRSSLIRWPYQVGKIQNRLDNGQRQSPTAADDGKRPRRRGQSFYSMESSRLIARCSPFAFFLLCGFAAWREILFVACSQTAPHMRDPDPAQRVVFRFTWDNRVNREKIAMKISCTYPNRSPSCLLALYAEFT
jgi:hypothetical protein